jgi:hypothetical protein
MGGGLLRPLRLAVSVETATAPEALPLDGGGIPATRASALAPAPAALSATAPSAFGKQVLRDLGFFLVLDV